MVEVPDEVMAQHVIDQALEYGEHGDTIHTISEGHSEYELDWTLNDLTPEDCTVDMSGESTVVVGGEIEGHYSVQTRSATYNPPGKAHPAEYRTETVTLHVMIEMDLSELPQPLINMELW